MKMLEYINKKFDFYNFTKAHSAGMEIQARFKKNFVWKSKFLALTLLGKFLKNKQNLTKFNNASEKKN